MQGPMVGPGQPDELRIWVRASGAHQIQVRYGRRPDLSDALLSVPVLATSERDFCATVVIGGLRPGEQYYYEVLVNGRPDKYQSALPAYRTRTAPSASTNYPLRICFGSCARFQIDPIQPIWTAVDRFDPDLFLWLGDNIYADAVDARVLAEEYRRQRSVATLQSLQARVPQAAIWDDHDFGLNDHDGTHPNKHASLVQFRRYWANPSYGTEGAPGVYFRYRIGPIEFLFLDVRFYRDPNADADGPEKTMLGKAQLDWLLASLKSSPAKFKCLVSGSGWTSAKGAGGDSWASFLTERNRLFAQIASARVPGVFLISGDTHVAELNAIPRPDLGYDLFELVSSPLAQPTTDSYLTRTPEQRVRPVYAGGPNFGVIDYDPRDGGRIRLNVADQGGRMVWDSVELSAAELGAGGARWQDRANAPAIQQLRLTREALKKNHD